MKEKLVIKNFGPIKSVELELGRFNVLIGENGTGKSTVAKVLAAIRNLSLESEQIPNYYSLLNRSSLRYEHFKQNLEVFGIERYLTNKSVIEFNDKWNGLFKLSNKSVEFEYDVLQNRDFLVKEGRSIYIPADRIATSLFSSSTWSNLIDINEGRVDLPKYFLRFNSLFNRLKKEKIIFDFSNVLGVKFNQVNGIDLIELSNGKSIFFSESASAIQSNLSMCLIINSSSKREIGSNNTNAFIVEEPELNLFPYAQNKLVQFFIENISFPNNTMLLTTHSPYILTSLNNMMAAYQAGQKNKERVNAIVDQKYWINPSDVSAYMMLANGKCEDIVDREEGIIMADKIDGVSEEINHQFSELLNIEFGIT